MNKVEWFDPISERYIKLSKESFTEEEYKELKKEETERNKRKQRIRDEVNGKTNKVNKPKKVKKQQKKVSKKKYNINVSHILLGILIGLYSTIMFYYPSETISYTIKVVLFCISGYIVISLLVKTFEICEEMLKFVLEYRVFFLSLTLTILIVRFIIRVV